MINRDTVAFTPDGTVRWKRAESSHGTLYAPEESLASSGLLLSMQRARDFGPRLTGGGFGDVYRRGELVMKESQFLGDDAVFWDRCAGMTAVRMNVAMQAGFERLGERARLPGGARITSPTILGMYVVHEAVSVRTLMSFEEGVHPTSHDDLSVIGTRADRRRIYDAAFRIVGGDPDSIFGYDDIPGNILIQRGGAEDDIAVVKLDTCNYKERDDVWQAFEADPTE